MKDFKFELNKGIFIEDYNILVEWQISQKDLLEKIGDIESLEIDENIEFKVVRYCVQSNILDSLERFAIAFNLVKGKMVSVNLSKNPCGSSIEEYFEQMQNFLEFRFGKPKGIDNLLGKMFKDKDKDDTVYKWSLNNVKIIHSMFDFNSRTTLEIIIK